MVLKEGGGRMKDLSRHETIISPILWEKLGDIHIIGCGATASNLLYCLSKLGISNKIFIYDFDRVEEHNLPNQYFTSEDVGEYKAVALKRAILKVNPSIDIVEKVEKVETLENKNGTIFCLVDTMKSRKEIFKTIHKNIKHYIDTRLGDYDFHYYIFRGNNEYQQMKYKETLCSDDVASVSLCGTKITLLPTIMVGVNSLILELNKITRNETYSNVIQLYANTLQVLKRSWM